MSSYASSVRSGSRLTEPSQRTTRLRNLGFENGCGGGALQFPIEARSSTTGGCGGRAAEAATTVARDSLGSRISPTRGSPVQVLQKHHIPPVCKFVALNMNSGCSGISASDIPWVNSWYRARAGASLKFLDSLPAICHDDSRLVDATSRTAEAMSVSKFVAISLSNFSDRHLAARVPATIEPPETLQIRANFRSNPKSFSRHSAPR